LKNANAKVSIADLKAKYTMPAFGYTREYEKVKDQWYKPIKENSVVIQRGACKSYASWSMSVCRGCTCATGLVSAKVSHGLLSGGNSQECKDWFGATDQFVRTYIANVRGVILVEKNLMCALTKKKPAASGATKMAKPPAPAASMPGYTDVTAKHIGKLTGECTKAVVLPDSSEWSGPEALSDPSLLFGSTKGRAEFTKNPNWPKIKPDVLTKLSRSYYGAKLLCADEKYPDDARISFSSAAGALYVPPSIKKVGDHNLQVSCGNKITLMSLLTEYSNAYKLRIGKKTKCLTKTGCADQMKIYNKVSKGNPAPASLPFRPLWVDDKTFADHSINTVVVADCCSRGQLLANVMVGKNGFRLSPMRKNWGPNNFVKRACGPYFGVQDTLPGKPKGAYARKFPANDCQGAGLKAPPGRRRIGTMYDVNGRSHRVSDPCRGSMCQGCGGKGASCQHGQLYGTYVRTEIEKEKQSCFRSGGGSIWSGLWGPSKSQERYKKEFGGDGTKPVKCSTNLYFKIWECNGCNCFKTTNGKKYRQLLVVDTSHGLAKTATSPSCQPWFLYVDAMVRNQAFPHLFPSPHS
jgi:hypothetical protein